MRKLLVVLVVGAMVALAVAPAMAESVNKQMTNDEYAAFMAQHKGKTPTAEMKEYQTGSRYPGCDVCATSNTRCPAGYKQVGYTEVLNFHTINHWGKDKAGPGGFPVVKSRTIVKNHVTVHDHIKAAICEPLKK